MPDKLLAEIFPLALILPEAVMSPVPVILKLPDTSTKLSFASTTNKLL